MYWISKRKGEKKYGIEVYEKFMDLFCKLPLCGVIDQIYFAVHGGISPEITSISNWLFYW
jgi:serine/threonine-protein phosphatase 2B catalytic subunit